MGRSGGSGGSVSCRFTKGRRLLLRSRLLLLLGRLLLLLLSRLLLLRRLLLLLLQLWLSTHGSTRSPSAIGLTVHNRLGTIRESIATGASGWVLWTEGTKMVAVIAETAPTKLVGAVVAAMRRVTAVEARIGRVSTIAPATLLLSTATTAATTATATATTTIGTGTRRRSKTLDPYCS